MPTEEITIRVDSDAAKAYKTATDVDRQKLDLLLSLQLQHALSDDGSLTELMHDIGRKAQNRGLTPDILETILNES
jgi:hypothetical protein